jgi:hypothetical protein
MSDKLLIYPPPPDSLVKPRLSNLASWLGPGVIIASVTIGSGELVFASRSGAIFGYGMLWCFLYAGLFKGIQVYTAARHITLTGEHPLVGWARPRSFPVLPLLIAVPAVGLMPVAFSAIPEILGGYILQLTGSGLANPAPDVWGMKEFHINGWTSLVMVIVLGLAMASTYNLFERVSAFVLGAIVVSVAIAVVWFGPNMVEFFRGLLIPRVDAFPDWIISDAQYAEEFHGRSPWLEVSLYLAAVGGGAFDYIGYVGMLREKKWGLAGQRVATFEELAEAVDTSSPTAAETVRTARQWTRAPLIDTALSFFFVILVTLLFAVLGNLVLNKSHAVPANDGFLIHQEQFLVALHPEMKWLYRVGVFLAFIGTLYGAYEVYKHTFTESVHAIVPKSNTAGGTRMLRRATVVWCFVGGMTMIWLPKSIAGSIVDRMTLGSVISGAAACGVWCFAMIWLDYARLPAPLRMSWPLRSLTAIAGLAMTLLGIQTTIAFFQEEAHGSAIPTDGVIATSGSYFFNQDIETDRKNGIRIEADDVVIDLRGHALRYSGDPQPGIFGIAASQRKNITIRNGAVGAFWFNTHLTQCQNVTIEDVKFDDIAYIGINVAKSKDVQIVRNHFTNFRYDIDKPKDKYLIGINIGAEDVVITNNQFHASPPDIQPDAHDIETVFVLFSARVSQRCIVGLNQMKSDRPLPRSYGVWVAKEAQATIVQNRVSNMKYAFCLATDGSATISRNHVAVDSTAAARGFESYGVFAKTPAELTVTHNIFAGVTDPTLMPEGTTKANNVISRKKRAADRN